MAPQLLTTLALISALSLSAVNADLATTTLPPNPTITLGPRAVVTPTNSPLPLTQYTYAYNNIPYQVNPYAVGRGPQSGYNICNNSTEGPGALCQTAIVNSISDFCLWGSPGNTSDGTISNLEAQVVAYCSRAGHGARIFPPGTITAIQFMRTPGYIQITGLLNQAGVNLDPTDTGGELDPHGDDSLGNPVGGLVYSTGLNGGNNYTYQQVTSWNNFIGSNQFCFKLCDPSYSTNLNYCENRYDLVGCEYNMPAAYAPGVFQSCNGDLQDVVGTYTTNGQTLTWSQPDPLTTNPPYTPRIPASSNCVNYQSTDLFPTSLLGYQATATSSSVARSTSTSASRATSSAGASRTGASSSAASATASTTKASGASLSSVPGGLVALAAAGLSVFVLVF
ncbi:hypothetical protein T439DRAFT_324968 [Meredithblackwellia eburnea MCA 4105]